MNDNRFSALSRMLTAAGPDRLRKNFKELASTNRREAIRLLEDEKLTFPPLFTVMPVIHAFGLTAALSPRNRTSMHICARKLGRYGPLAAQTETADDLTLRETLSWMFGTGRSYEAAGADRDEYEAVIDYTAALLIIDFEDTSILPEVADLIFRRHKSGRLINDLAWSFYQTLDADVLSQVAGKLLSRDARELTLSCKMLGLEAPRAANEQEARNLYGDYVAWLDDNKPYLYATGEHFQQTSRPKPLDVDLEAKYLGKELSPRYRAPTEPLTEREVACLHEYRGYPPEERDMLTEYSHRLRRADARAWDDWMSRQVAEQVIAAKSGYVAI